MSSVSRTFNDARQYLNKHLFARIGTVTLLAVLFALGVLFYYLTYKAASESNKSKHITAQLSSQAVVDKVDRNFYERFGDVQAFAFNKLAIEAALNDSATAETQQFVNTMVKYYVLYDLMMICNKDGEVLVTNTIDKNGKAIDNNLLLFKKFNKTDWFEACVESAGGPEGGAWYSDFMISDFVGRMYGDEGYGMAFAAPIRDANNQVIGVWYNFASWEDVTEGIRVETENHLRKTEPDAQVVITRRTGEIISASKIALVKNEVFLDSVSVLKDNSTSFFDNDLTIGDYVIGWGKSQGAYTYRGQRWIGATLIPRSVVSWRIFFARENFPAIATSLAALLIIGVLLLRYFNKHVITRIDFIQSILEKLSKGDAVEIPASIRDSDEIGSMIIQLSTLADTIKQKAAFSDEIANGNFNAELTVVSENDVLGNSLINMRNQLRTTREEDKQQSWVAEGLAQVGTLLRAKNSSQELYDDVIRFIVKYLKATQGGLFLLEKNDDTSYLDLVACYAYERKKFIEKQIPLGSGLTGQCALEKKTIYLNEIPADYLFITSGLGSANPRSLLIVPMMINEEVQGILEVASFSIYKPYEIEFVEKLAQSVAAIVSNIRTEENTRHLLGQSQQQTEQMLAQEEEMRQNMEQLQATQEEMARKEKELAKLLNLSDTNKTEMEFRLNEIERFKEENQKMLDSVEKNKKDVIEILNQIPAKIFLKDSKGYMVLCDAQLAKAYNLSIDQLIGTNDYDHLERSLAQSYFEKEQEIIRTGVQTYIQEERLTGELQYWQTTKMPFFISQLNEIGLLGYQFDVTKVHLAESVQRKLNEQVAKLKQEIDVLKEMLSK